MSVEVKVDRLHVGLVFNSKCDENFVATRGWVHSVRCQEFPKKGKVWSLQKGFSLTNASQPLSQGEVFVRYGHHAKKFCAWYQFNPSKVDLIELGVHFNLMLGAGFNTLYSSGIATYSEIAIDIIGASFHDYLFVDTALRKSNNTYEQLGTEYLGSRLGNRSVTCYDKRKECLKHTGKDIGHERLRIETHLRGANRFPVSDIAALQNPFQRLMVVDKKMLANSGALVAADFRKRVASHQDAQMAYTTMTKSKRAAVREVLQPLQPQWWGCPKTWDAFPKSLGWIKTLRAQS